PRGRLTDPRDGVRDPARGRGAPRGGADLERHGAAPPGPDRDHRAARGRTGRAAGPAVRETARSLPTEPAARVAGAAPRSARTGVGGGPHRLAVGGGTAAGPDRTEMPTVPTTVVVAEDEAIIRMDLRELLQEEGYEVVAECG